MARPLDVLLYGASGFTGRLVAAYLARHAPTLRIGLAGRCADRLRAARVAASNCSALPEWGAELHVASAEDELALRALAARASVVISTAGPFSACGTPLVRACLHARTDYVDINGEVPWMKQLVEELDEEAREAGVRIVPSCGYTVPSDLGTWLTVQSIRERYGCATRSVSGLIQFNGRLSGGTMATGLLLDRASAAEQAQRKDPFVLGGAPAGGEVRAEDRDSDEAVFDSVSRCWTAPFWMATISSRVVRRSHELFRQQDGIGYGAEFSYSERALARDESVAKNMASEMPSPERRERLIARGKLPSPGQGPSAEVRAKSWFRLLLLGRSEDGRWMATHLLGGDPGYDETSKFVSEAAILLASRRTNPSLVRRGGNGGVLTPASALGQPFVNALAERGINFQQFPAANNEEVADVVQTLINQNGAERHRA
ncbi:hypothetical protein AB1Y20_000669 [Prymnesium parvum]|uniref:Saccharopine dehydrogenase NADP binding domain-containing protein n=1 Tax=Prymnesium parvum TaxID=97485 RepID=A0AB34K914_PRYPA